MEAKIKKAQTIANQTGIEQIVIKSCYGIDIIPATDIFPAGQVRSLSGCIWKSVRPVAA
jgi:hypothetical protein